MQQVYGIPLLFVALHPSQSSPALFTLGYFAEDARSLSICSPVLPQYVLE